MVGGGVDGSVESRAALHWAVVHARRTGGRVTAVAVSELLPMLAPGAGFAGGWAGAGMVVGTVPGAVYGAVDDENVTAEAELAGCPTRSERCRPRRPR